MIAFFWHFLDIRFSLHPSLRPVVHNLFSQWAGWAVPGQSVGWIQLVVSIWYQGGHGGTPSGCAGRYGAGGSLASIWSHGGRGHD